MKNYEFAYWFQGYFELREADDILTFDQIECIRKHIKLVEKVEKDNINGFIMWLKGALDVISHLKSLEDHVLTNLIKEKLGECFKHEIDNSYGKDLHKVDQDKLKEKLDEIHNGKKFPRSNPKIPRYDPWRKMTC